MSALPMIPRLSKVEVVLIERRRAGWATGTGPIGFGQITRRLQSHATEEAAVRAGTELADQLDMLAFRS